MECVKLAIHSDLYELCFLHVQKPVPLKAAERSSLSQSFVASFLSTSFAGLLLRTRAQWKVEFRWYQSSAECDDSPAVY